MDRGVLFIKSDRYAFGKQGNLKDAFRFMWELIDLHY